MRRSRSIADQGRICLCIPHWKVTPAADKVDTGSLLADIKAQIERYVATLGNRSIVPAVFTMFTWLQKGATHSPQLVVTSAEADSGKTTLTGVMKFLTRRSIATVGITGAVLFRSIEKWDPTLIIDEADTVLTDNDDLRTVVNSGWTRGESVLRCDPISRDPRPYSTFAAKILAMKKHRGRVALPDTTLSRSIILELKRKTAAERVDDFDHLDCEEFGSCARGWRGGLPTTPIFIRQSPKSPKASTIVFGRTGGCYSQSPNARALAMNCSPP